MFVEFKNYFLPLRESKQRWILLKTLTGFLNSKGGTIYIGVEDKQGQVLGLPLPLKEQQEFDLFMRDFVQRIRPAVDLDKEEVPLPPRRSRSSTSPSSPTRSSGASTSSRSSSSRATPPRPTASHRG